MDQLVYPSIEALYRTFGREPFDIIIDDGLHSAGANLNMLRFALSGALKPANPNPHPHPHPNPNPNQVETTPYAALLFNNCLDNGEP